MPTRDQVRELIDAGEQYSSIANQLDVPAGQAYLIATGAPADGSSATKPRGSIGSRAQGLINPREMTETVRGDVHEWVRQQAFTDPGMRPKQAGAGSKKSSAAKSSGAKSDAKKSKKAKKAKHTPGGPS